jgi:hypothetical protein
MMAERLSFAIGHLMLQPINAGFSNWLGNTGAKARKSDHGEF